MRAWGREFGRARRELFGAMRGSGNPALGFPESPQGGRSAAVVGAATPGDSLLVAWLRINILVISYTPTIAIAGATPPAVEPWCLGFVVQGQHRVVSPR